MYGNAVTHASVGVDIFAGVTLCAQLSPQGFDVGVYGAVSTVGVCSPHGIEQCFARVDAPGRLKQLGQ